MEETGISNQQKQANYTEQFRRLKLALRNGFNMEAMFIEYAILEDRTESVLRHGGYWDAYMKKRKGKGSTIHSKITYIQGKANSGDRLLLKYFSDDILEQVLRWKEERNRLIHALLVQKLTDEEVTGIAAEGNELVRLVRSRVSAYNKAVQKGKEVL